MKIMFKILLLTFLMWETAFAQTLCPSVADIKEGIYGEWLALNFNNDEPASPAQITKFKKTIYHFSGALWSADYEYGHGRCRYDSKAEVYLATNYIPIVSRPTTSPWTWDGSTAHCPSSSIVDCVFP